MQRGHAEDALAGEFEGTDLQHHRDGFHDEDATHDEQHDFLPHDDRDHTQRSTQCQGADITHEDLGRIGVEPEKTETGAADGGAEYGELTGARHIGHAQIFGEIQMACDVGENRQRARHHDSRHNGETVEAIGEVHGVAGADNDEIGQHDEADSAQRQHRTFEKREDQLSLGRYCRGREKIDGHAKTYQRLPEIFFARGQPLGVAVHDLAPVVHPADDTKTERGKQYHPDETVTQIGP